MNRRAAGRSVAQALKQSAEHLRRQQSECQTSLRKLDESSNDLVDRRGFALLELAKHYFPEVTRETALASFRGIRDELLDVLARKQRRERQLHEAVKQDETEALRLQANLEQVTDDLNEKVAERQRLEERVAEKLKAHQKFQTLSSQALLAEQELERNEERIAEINQEASEKLPAYENNRLFRYLYDRGYGSPEYNSKGVTKQLDRWVAKFVNFGRSRRSYDFLRVTPELMAAEVLRRREQFHVLMEQIEAIEDKISGDIGLTRALRQGQELGTRRDSAVSELALLEQKFTAHHQELLALEGKQNEFYDLGVGQMKTFLAEMEHSWLEHQSRSTPDRQDDQLVSEIGWLNEKLDHVQRESGQLVREQRNWDQRITGLQDVMQRFRRADFDSRRSFFSGDFNVERHLSSYVHGELGSEELWSLMRRSQQFQSSRYERPGSPLPDGAQHSEWDSEGSWGTSSVSGVLGRVLVEVAGEALKHAVRRGMQRRGPFRIQQRKNKGLPPLHSRWFTDGKGF